MNNINAFHSRTIGVIRISLALIALLWLGAIALRADTHYVSLTGGNVLPYTNWTDAASNNIQAAINAASAGETVLVSNGTYNLTGQISITNNITVQSLYGTNDAGLLTIINGNYPTYTNRCFYINNGTLDGFTVTNGFCTNSILSFDGGGGIRIQSTGFVYNCFICANSYSNSSDYTGGGGVSLMSGGIVTNCTIISNTVHYAGGGESNYKNAGGGVYLYSNGLVVASRISGNMAFIGGGTYQKIQPVAGRINISIVSNCVVDNNRATYRYGGMYVAGSECRVANCVVSNNIADDSYGGMGVYASVVVNSIIIGNTGTYAVWLQSGAIMSNCQVIANSGPGVNLYGYDGSNVIANCIIARNNGIGLMLDYNWRCSQQLAKNCLIYNNTNTGSGGGVYLNNISPYPYGLINCTIVSNTAGKEGGGIYAAGANNYIGNCIIYDNAVTNGDYAEIYNSSAGNTNNYWHTCARSTPAAANTTLAPNQGNTTMNPQFVDQANRNYRLGKISPCVNTGTNQNWMTNGFDLDGKIRIRYLTVDMGAYERIYEGVIFSAH